MSHQDIFLQTITDIGPEVQAYSIQSVDDDTNSNLPEEYPMMGLGPLGKINIFVGATNAGKSRFLRLLAKCERPKIFHKEAHQAISDFMTAVTWLDRSREELYFEVRQKVGRTMGDRSPIVLRDVPKWGKSALEHIRPEYDYELTFNSDFFTFMLGFFPSFLSTRISGSGKESGVIATEVAERLQIGKWAHNLLLGELESRERRDQPMAAYNRHVYEEQHWVDSWRTGERLLKFDYGSVFEQWRERFALLWTSFEYRNYSGIACLLPFVVEFAQLP